MSFARLELQETTYGWAVEMILKGTLAGFRIVEVPVSYYPRIGKSKISGTLRGHSRSGVVHSLADRALLFPARKSQEIRGQRECGRHLPYGILQQTNAHVRRTGLHLVIMAKAPRPGTVKTRLAHEPSRRGGHRTLSLPFGRHHRAGAVVGQWWTSPSCARLPTSKN